MAYRFRGFEARTDMIEKLEEYVQHRVALGHFLTAVLENNLSEAVGRADEDNLKNLPAFVGYMYNEMPGGCWGSPEKVKAWLENAQ